MKDAKIYIAIPVHNRLEIAKLCIPTVASGISISDRLAIYNDGSDEEFLPHFGETHRRDYRFPIGIEAQRRMHIADFMERAERSEFTHLYLTDSDALHDPDWRLTLLQAQAKHGHAPICGYNTEAHERLCGNTIADGGDVLWRRVAPGISYLLTLDHVKRIWPHAAKMRAFDWEIPALLGNRFAVMKESVVDHIGLGGMHHPVGVGLEGGDRALNPTKWLAEKRAEVVSQLKSLCPQVSL